MNDQPTKRTLDEIVKGWLGVAEHVVSIALTAIIGLQLLKHQFGFDVIDWISALIQRQRIRAAVRAWEKEHRNDGTTAE